jgi:hypothetical protein
MKRLIRLSLLFFGVCTGSIGCSFQKFASEGVLYRALHLPTDDTLAKDSETLVGHFRNTTHDTTWANRLSTFDQGCYLMQMRNDDIPLVRTHPKSAKKDTISVTGYKIENGDSLLPKTDFVIYLTFLDHYRVLYHSPYRHIYFKDGNAADSVNVFDSNWQKNPKKYASKTLHYFKMGMNCDYNSVRRGYYKINRSGLKIWLETYREKQKGNRKAGKKIVLTELDFDAPISSDGRIESLKWKESWFRNKKIEADRLDFNRTSAEFLLHRRPFKLLVMNEGKVNIIDSLAQNGTERFYFPQKKSGTRPAALKPEKINNVYTF